MRDIISKIHGRKQAVRRRNGRNSSKRTIRQDLSEHVSSSGNRITVCRFTFYTGFMGIYFRKHFSKTFPRNLVEREIVTI